MRHLHGAFPNNSITPAASSSAVQLPPMPTPLQSQMGNDPLYRTMEMFSGAQDMFRGHDYGAGYGSSDEDGDGTLLYYGRSVIRNPASQIEQ